MKVIIVGGCGFIGSNAADRLASIGWEVTLFDSLVRKGAERNLEWLRSRHHLRFVQGDIRNEGVVEQALQGESYDVLLHLAAQVAVTTSVERPRYDFEVNALGTFNVLEAVRTVSPETIVLNASTNKVYGKLALLEERELKTRYEVTGLPLGVAESQPLDFHSPYGCSKGAAEQYVSDYARIYKLRTVNFRQSCIYGPRQFGVEDQGWVAWFAIAHTVGLPVKLYGTGKQVRDLLHVGDLVDCYLRAVDCIDAVSGMTFNVGGGPANTLSLLELLALLEKRSGRPVDYGFGDWRPGDQPVYISDIRQAERLLGWQPQIPVEEGVGGLWDWIQANSDLFEAMPLTTAAVG
ncbi:MAG: GDP-mannose 4,6-dehydratase [Bryobacterales bacterium]|nr:GDP-mannose 4,6-dehydratase [Bryobacterales bacterium]